MELLAAAVDQHGAQRATLQLPGVLARAHRGHQKPGVAAEALVSRAVPTNRLQYHAVRQQVNGTAEDGRMAATC